MSLDLVREKLKSIRCGLQHQEASRHPFSGHADGCANHVVEASSDGTNSDRNGGRFPARASSIDAAALRRSLSGRMGAWE